MIDDCYQCHTPLEISHKSWFCNDHCKNAYWSSSPKIMTRLGALKRMNQFISQQKKKDFEMAQQQEMEHLVSIYREEF